MCFDFGFLTECIMIKKNAAKQRRQYAWAIPRILYLSCGVPFPVWTPDNISGLISVVPWLLR